jgi:hypothetical protein
MAGRPEQDVVVEILLATQIVDACQVVLVAEDQRAMRQRVHQRAKPVKTKIITFGLLQSVEGKYENVGLVGFEIGNGTRRIGRSTRVLELLR